jgi:ABC-2 type transport system permease protein
VVRNTDQIHALLRARFGTEDYLTFLFPGVAVFTILVNSILGGVPILFDRETGFMDKVLAAPVSRVAILLARFLYVLLYSLLQVALVGAVGLALGLNAASPLVAAAAIVLYGGLLCAGITILSLALAFVLPHHSIYFSITGFMLSPLLVLSPTFVVRRAMPGWMAEVARWNPMTHAIEPIRAAFLGTEVDWLKSALILLAFDAVCLAWATRIVRKRMD